MDVDEEQPHASFESLARLREVRAPSRRLRLRSATARMRLIANAMSLFCPARATHVQRRPLRRLRDARSTARRPLHDCGHRVPAAYNFSEVWSLQ
jgi:hypothetical protein